MRAIQYSRYGSPDVLDLVDLPAPVPAPDEALIAVQCASVIPGDWKVRAGHLPPYTHTHLFRSLAAPPIPNSLS